MILRASFAVFFALSPVVLYAQNVNQGPPQAAQAQAQAGARKAAVANGSFPSRVDTQVSWEAKEPRDTSVSATAAGPSTTSDGDMRLRPQGQHVAAAPLPSPKIDYVKEATERVSPMGPKEIRKFNDEMYARMLESSRVPGGDYTLMGTRMQRVSLAPGAKPESISIAMGMGTMVSFVDRTGARLVVDSVEGFSDVFSVRVMATEMAEKEGAHTFSIDAKRPTGQGNVSVQLLGVVAPFVFRVDVGKKKEVDSHVQFVLPIVSSKRAVLPGDRMADDATFAVEEMQGFLAGIPPEGAVEVKVSQVGDTTAWMWRNMLYLRTPHTVNAGWFNRQASADGMAIYKLPLTPMLFLSAEGREVRAILDYPYIPPISKSKN